MRTRVLEDEVSQVVMIPKEFEFDVDEVEIFQRENETILRKPVRSDRQQDLPREGETAHARDLGEKL